MQHAVLLTPDAANASGAFQRCIYCSRPKRADKRRQAASSYAREAEELLRDFAFYPPCPPIIITESKVLGGKLGAIDLSFPVRTSRALRWVHVEVDSSTHFEKPWGGGAGNAQQAADRRKDAAAWEQGRMLVRLHFADKDSWRAALNTASSYASEEAMQRFILYTDSYKLLGLQTKVERWGLPPLPTLQLT